MLYTALQPPLLPDHADSESKAPLLCVYVVVPPTAMTLGEVAGYPGAPPESPVATKNDTPLLRPLVKMRSEEVETELPSEPPQLMLTMSASPIAVCTAGYRSALDGLLAVTRMILAPGATE